MEVGARSTAENKPVMVLPQWSLQSSSGDRLSTMKHEETVERKGREEAGAFCKVAWALTFLTHSHLSEAV